MCSGVGGGVGGAYGAGRAEAAARVAQCVVAVLLVHQLQHPEVRLKVCTKQLQTLSTVNSYK